MENSNISDLLSFLEFGTKLHIGVLFFGNYGNEKLKVTFSRTIHDSPVCSLYKLMGKKGYMRCFLCRSLAIKKALIEKKEFAGQCINGVYEFTRPIVMNGKVIAMIFIGNISTEDLQSSLQQSNNSNLIKTLEDRFDFETCRRLANIIEDYIRLILEKFPPDTKKSDNIFLIENIKSYIKSNLEFSISSNQISQVFNYNAKYIGRLFKEKVGMSLSEYTNKERIKRACSLIQTTNLTITEIAYSVGFYSVTYFDRIFNNVCGCTPLEYKKEITLK